MGRRKRRYYDTYEAIKSCQHVTKLRGSTVHSWEIEEMMVNGVEHQVNKRRRSRVGHVENRKRR